MSCGCNGHISYPTSTQNPSDWSIHPYGNESSDRVYHSRPYITTEDLNDDGVLNTIKNLVENEVNRRTGDGSAIRPVFTQGSTHYASTVDQIRKNLIAVYNDGTINSFTTGTKITASYVNKILTSNYNAGKICVCNCNYCECNSNKCICNCHYRCTCNCNYSDITLKTEIEYI